MKTTQESFPQHNISQWEDEIKQLVDDCRIHEARHKLSDINEMGIDSPILKEWQIVLAPPKYQSKMKPLAFISMKISSGSKNRLRNFRKCGWP